MEEDIVGPLLNCETQEVVKLTEILHGKLPLKCEDRLLKEGRAGDCKNDVIHI